MVAPKTTPDTKSTTDIFAIQHYLGAFTYFRLVMQAMNPESVASTQIPSPYVQEVSFCGLPQVSF